MPTIEQEVTPEVVPAAVEPVVQEVISEPQVAPVDNASNMMPIDLVEIEKKYEEMIATINRLKEQELEAAKRYNATIELSAMHNEQHANYVASEQSKETVVNSAPSVEPTPVETVVPEPVQTQVSNPTDIETNWFDMPAA